MDYNGVQLGIDKLITTRTANFYLGTMVGYTDGDPNYKHGSGGARDINAVFMAAILIIAGSILTVLLSTPDLRIIFQ